MQRPGIEPGPEPWEGSIIPLDYRCVHHFFVGYALIAGLGARWLAWLYYLLPRFLLRMSGFCNSSTSGKTVSFFPRRRIRFLACSSAITRFSVVSRWSDSPLNESIPFSVCGCFRASRSKTYIRTSCARVTMILCFNNIS